MRRIFNFMLLVATVTMAASCVDENGSGLDSGRPIVPMTFIGYIDDGQTPDDTDPDLRTSIGEAVGPEGQRHYPVRWSTSDHITVFYEDGPGVPFTDVTVNENGSQATFRGETGLSDFYYAIYPKHDTEGEYSARFSEEDRQISAILPTVQPATHNTFADGVNLAIAKSEGENLYFKNVGALLTVTCPTNYAKSIKVISRDPSVKMSGRASITYNDGEPIAVPSDNAANYVEVTCKQTTKDDVYYFVVYPGNYSKGFDILITSYNAENESCCLLSSTKPLDLKRNTKKGLFDGVGFTMGWNCPAMPSSVHAALVNQSKQDVNVTWAWSGDKSLISGYKVYARIAGSTEDGELMGTINESVTKEYTVTGLEPGQTYEFGVQATKGGTAKKDTYIIWSNTVTIPELEKCAAPTNLLLEHLNPARGSDSYPNPNRVTITWIDNSGIEAGYLFWKWTGSNDPDTAPIDANGTRYETSVTVGTTYTFGVQAKGTAGNDSDITKMENYTPKTWLELLDYQATDGECIIPVFASITQDSENQATINWTCGSSAAVGYNIYCREKSQPQWTEVYKYMTKTANGVKETSAIIGLENGKTYIFGVQAVGSTMERNSNVAVAEFAMVSTAETTYDWETARGRVPEFADMTLCYGGDPQRSPYLWDKSRWSKHVVYEDVNNPGQYFWLFDSFLALETKTNDYYYALTSNGKPSATQEHWFQQLNYWFDGVNGFQALDDCIEENIAKAGPYPHKRYIIFSLPDPIYFQNYGNQSGGTTYWGSIYNQTMDFSDYNHRIMAYKWMINQVRARFAAKNYRHIELAGFYILSETFSETYKYSYKLYRDVIPAVATYCKSKYEGLYWIPYSYEPSSGDTSHNKTFQNWKDYGLTSAILQPNYYWDTNKSLTTTCNYIQDNDMGMEFEFEGSHGEGGWSKNKTPRTSSSILETVMTDDDAEGTPKGQPNPQAATNKGRFKQYMSECKSSGIYDKNRMLVLYSGTNGWVELANSSDQLDKNLYDETAKFFLKHPYKQSLYNSTTPDFNYGGSLN